MKKALNACATKKSIRLYLGVVINGNSILTVMLGDLAVRSVSPEDSSLTGNPCRSYAPKGHQEPVESP